MIDFGYRKNRSTKIDLDLASVDVYDRVRSEEPSVGLCISCGTCASTCSAAQFTDFNLRKIILLCKRGETNALTPIINRCMLCGKCQFACPKGVNTRHIILLLNQYLHEGTIA